mmetsp:Transcript_27115/g.20285  ORF Transcript_27115/g.20285 Transcript_27115/m.20285 type:complete len:145 (+) Transcript_27115:123-557(+)
MDSIEKKASKLDDFIKVTEDRHFFLVELFENCQKMEGFLREDESFKTLAMDLRRKSNIVLSCQDALTAFLENLDAIQKLEQYLQFEPVFDVREKLEQLKQLEVGHVQQLVKSEQNSEEVERLLAEYNELVAQLSDMILALNRTT